MTPRAGLLLVAAIGLNSRALGAAVLRPPGGLIRQEPSVMAANVNAGLGFIHEQYGTMVYGLKEPGHIALLALLLRVFGDRDLPILVLQWTCGVAVAVLAAALTRRLTADAGAGLVAGILVATNPFLVSYDSRLVHSLSLDMLLFVVTVAANVWAVEPGHWTWRRAALAGAVTGVALWQRSLLLFGGLGLWAVAIVLARGARVRETARAVLWIVVAVALVVPWFVRNHQLIGRWVYTSDFAHVLWLGNNPHSNGTYTDARGIRVIDHMDRAIFYGRVVGKSETEQMDVFLELVKAWVREHPGRAAALVARKALAFVWFAPNIGAEYTRRETAAYMAWYVVLLALGMAGAWHVWRLGDGARRRRLALVAGTMLGIIALHAIVAINMKHRVPLEIVLSGCAGFYVARVLRAVRRA